MDSSCGEHQRQPNDAHQCCSRSERYVPCAARIKSLPSQLKIRADCVQLWKEEGGEHQNFIALLSSQFLSFPFFLLDTPSPLPFIESQILIAEVLEGVIYSNYDSR